VGGASAIAPVSIIVPAYNCGPYIAEAIGSALNQTRPPSQIIVVDDGSTDDTDLILGAFDRRIQIIRQTNSGVANARNTGLAAATSPYVMFFDADDRLEPTALEMLLSSAPDDASCVVYGDKYVISHDGAIEERVAGRDCTGPIPSATRASFNGSAFEPGAAIVPRRVVADLGGFRQKYSPCEDRDLWIRLGIAVEFRYARSVILHYRSRPGSGSRNRVKHVTGSLRVRLDFLSSLQTGGPTVFDPAPNAAALVAADLNDVYWQREWAVVDAILDLADEYRLNHPDIARIRRARKLFPPWLIWLKDRVDRVSR
jgi:glycosyltransferase involved in cell wall biosynthesis